MLMLLVQASHIEKGILGHYKADVRQRKQKVIVQHQIQTNLQNKLFKH